MAAAHKPKPTQKTTKGHEIRVPTRGEFFRDLTKVAKPPSGRKRRPKKYRGELRSPIVAVVVPPCVFVQVSVQILH
jgi:hypothetical protein